MSEDNKVALVEALSKLGLGTLLAIILASVIYFNHTEQSILSEIMKNSDAHMEKSNEIQIRLLTAMEINQENQMKVFNEYVKNFEKTSEVIKEIIKDK